MQGQEYQSDCCNNSHCAKVGVESRCLGEVCYDFFLLRKLFQSIGSLCLSGRTKKYQNDLLENCFRVFLMDSASGAEGDDNSSR